MKILIADDHPMVRDALARTVRSIDPDVEILEAGNYAEVETQLADRPTLALLDIHMPGMDGMVGVRRLLNDHQRVRIVVASGEDDPAVIRSVLALGAAGYLPKTDPPEMFVHALKVVLAGGCFTPAQALYDLKNGPSVRPSGKVELTPRQTDVLRGLMRGEPNKVIARDLGLTEGTVKIHIAAILRALQARNRTEAVVNAGKLGLNA